MCCSLIKKNHLSSELEDYFVKENLHGHCTGARQLSVYSLGPSQLADEPDARSQLRLTLT